MAQLKKSKGLYWALISTFIFLWAAVAFVSTLHAISFFQITNMLGLAILLGTAYEIGQASVLFSILMTENKNRLLAWSMLLLLTALQVTANVYASFRFMEMSGLNDWTYWQKAVLLGMEFDDPEMYKIVISWISGALLPVVALGLTALVADNIAMVRAEKLKDLEQMEQTQLSKNTENETQEDDFGPLLLEEEPDQIKKEKEDIRLKEDDDEDEDFNDLLDVQDDLVSNQFSSEKLDEVNTFVEEEVQEEVEEEKIEPVNKPRGWHFKNEFIDDVQNVFRKGKYSHTIPKEKKSLSKKA